MIVEALRRIATSEQVEVDTDALLAIARGAEGGMRDALSALDQIISFKGSPVTEADVLAIFGLVSRANLERLTTAMLSGDMGGGLQIIDDLDRGGKDLRRLVLELLEHVRNLLVFQHLGGKSDALDVTPEQLAALERQAQLADSGRILRIAELLADLEGRIRYALSRRTLLETVFVRCCRAATVATLDQLIRQLTELQSGEDAAPQPPAAQSGRAAMTAEPPRRPDVAAPVAAAPVAAAPAPAASAPVASAPIATAPETPSETAPRPPSVMEDKGVQAALELFGGQVVRVEDAQP